MQALVCVTVLFEIEEPCKVRAGLDLPMMGQAWSPSSIPDC